MMNTSKSPAQKDNIAINASAELWVNIVCANIEHNNQQVKSGKQLELKNDKKDE